MSDLEIGVLDDEMCLENSGAALDNPNEQKSEPVNEDASIKEIFYYAIGNIEGSAANHFFNILQQVMVIGMSINPMLIGFILGIKTFWDSVTDPIMAHITDNTKSRWGRRKPYIVVGGILRIALLVFIIWFFPSGTELKTNQELDQIKAEQATEKAEVAASEVKAPAKKAKSLSSLEKLQVGWSEFQKPENAGQRKIVLYVLVAMLLFTTLTTVNSVPYYALGIEMCTSYDGRTKLTTWSSITGKIAGLISPWIPAFCFSLMFYNALEGLKWVAILTALIGIPSTILMGYKVKERYVEPKVKPKKMNLFMSMFSLLKNIHFVKIFLLYVVIGMTLHLFGSMGFYLNVYWVKKSALGGSMLGGWVTMMGWLLSFIALPFMNWGCRKFQKHLVMRFSVIWMAIGTALKWWCINPDYPYLQLVLPFFFSIGISCTYSVLSTMMADITDVDELITGHRREGMFGAVNAFLLKMVMATAPVMAGVILVLSGFDADLGFQQAESTITNMRLLDSFIPAVCLLIALVILWRYPITRERLAEIQEELKKRRTAAEA